MSYQDWEANKKSSVQGTFSNSERELAIAQKALLDNDFILPSDEAFVLIRAHNQALQAWHDEHTSWHIERSLDRFYLLRYCSSFPSIQKRETLQSPRDFAYLFWILWHAAEGHPRYYAPTQSFSLREMLEQIKEEWQRVGLGIELSLDEAKNRHSMGRTLKYLTEHNYIKHLRGHLDEWIELDHDENASTIYYRFTNDTTFLIASLHFESAEAIKIYLQQNRGELRPRYLHTSSERCAPLTRAWRNLLLGPAFIRYDDPEAFDSLQQSAHLVQLELLHNFNWLLELNPYYACIERNATTTSKQVIILRPQYTTDQLILLLCGTLREQVANKDRHPNAYGCLLLSQNELRNILLLLHKELEEKTARPKSSMPIDQRLEDVYKKMREADLLRGPDTEEQILILPTAARYAPRFVQEKTEPTPRDPRKNAYTSIEPTNLPLWSEDETAVND